MKEKGSFVSLGLQIVIWEGKKQLLLIMNVFIIDSKYTLESSVFIFYE